MALLCSRGSRHISAIWCTHLVTELEIGALRTQRFTLCQGSQEWRHMGRFLGWQMRQKKSDIECVILAGLSERAWRKCGDTGAMRTLYPPDTRSVRVEMRRWA